MVENNYFVCTLGEAAQNDINRPFNSVNDLVDKQSRDHSDLPAIGFYNVPRGVDDNTTFDTTILTFQEVESSTKFLAAKLKKQFKLKEGSSIGLLAASSPAFFFTWLACIRIGHPVLLLAPQLSASAIAHLSEVCEVTVLLADQKYHDLGEKACEQLNTGCKVAHLPFSNEDDVFSEVKGHVEDVLEGKVSKADDLAYLHHTSGTSSGLPKPIPQTQHGAIGVLPALDGSKSATFTTTPLYHGGPADIFRAWSSQAMIWLYPSQDVPVTAKNICKCLQAAQKASKDGKAAKVKYFGAVPYVLRMMAEDKEGMDWLQDMDLVGVGGAALAPEVGEKLVEQNINLVSRFGSAECGFLLSSHRNYEQDKDWQYLRDNDKSSQISFEPREGNLHELVIKSKWPHMAKRNRDDGSFATFDLFVKHKSIPNAWQYHSRADSQLTLVTGKKFDPAPLEDEISAASSQIADALVFGNSQPYPGVLVFKSESSKDLSDEDFSKIVQPIVEKLNVESQSHSRIPRNMIIGMPYFEQPLEKSSKGTVSRKVAEEKYAQAIADAYSQVSATSENVSDEDVPKRIADLVSSIMGSENTISENEDMFSHGVDSVACVQIRHGLARLLPEATAKLPLTVVEDSRTISALSQLILDMRHGNNIAQDQDPRSYIPTLVKKYSKVMKSSSPQSPSDGISIRKGKVVLLTGATGSLGAHILSQLLVRSDIVHTYVLVRGASQVAARERVFKALSSRKLELPKDIHNKVTIYQCNLSEPNLGLNDGNYAELCNKVDLVLHLAWAVNFLLSLHSFDPHLASIQNLLNLCIASPKQKAPKLVFASSVASVSGYGGDVPEQIICSTKASGSTGYALSKLTAELTLALAATTEPRLAKNISVIRVGQLSADTRHGVWNKSEAYPQILASSKFTGGVLPDLGVEEELTWLPVDIAAAAFIDASSNGWTRPWVASECFGHARGGRSPYFAIEKLEAQGLDGMEIDKSAVQVMHLVGPSIQSTFTDFLLRLQKQDDLNGLKIVLADEWLECLDKLQSQHSNSAAEKGRSQDPSQILRLLPFWKQAYNNRQPSIDNKSTPRHELGGKTSASSDLKLDIHNSLIMMPALTRWLGRNTKEGSPVHTSSDLDAGTNSGISRNMECTVVNALLEDEYVRKTWRWCIENVP